MFSLGGSKSHNKHGSSHGNRQTASHKHSSNKPTKKARFDGGQGAAGTVQPSFLFVINELVVDYEPLPGERPLTDGWLNTVPPQRADAYTGELVGTVFRYQGGVVSPAHGYLWHRPALNHEGCIVRVNSAGMIDGYPAIYRAQTIFACSPLLPMIVTDGDASLGCTFLRRLCPCDARYDDGRCSTWFPLHFGSGGGAGGALPGGVSCVYSACAGDPFVAGRDPAWIPALVPSAYRNTTSASSAAAPPPSRGLAGHLPIILALMGFHGKMGRASEVFAGRSWHMNRWCGPGRASSYLPKSGEMPRGLYVQVCADNLVDGQPDDDEHNVPEEVWMEILGYLEYSTILVHG